MCCAVRVNEVSCHFEVAIGSRNDKSVCWNRKLHCSCHRESTLKSSLLLRLPLQLLSPSNIEI